MKIVFGVVVLWMVVTCSAHSAPQNQNSASLLQRVQDSRQVVDGTEFYVFKNKHSSSKSVDHVVLAFHGIACTGASLGLYESFVQERGIALVAPTLPGMGGTAIPKDLAAWDRQVLAVAKAHGSGSGSNTKVTVLGISLGGLHAQRLAASHASEIKNLVLMGSVTYESAMTEEEIAQVQEVRPDLLDALYGATAWRWFPWQWATTPVTNRFLLRHALGSVPWIRALSGRLRLESKEFQDLFAEQMVESWTPEGYRTHMEILRSAESPDFRALKDSNVGVIIAANYYDTIVPPPYARALSRLTGFPVQWTSDFDVNHGFCVQDVPEVLLSVL